MNRDQFIDWAANDSHLFVNRKDPDIEKFKVDFARLPLISNHIWLRSSGSNSEIMLYALSKTAFLVSSEAVNEFLQLNKKDIWLNVLPLHHVGGLSIFARAYLTRSKVIDRSQDQWSPEKFHVWASESKATVTSLVPTQVYDLVKLKKSCPASVRIIVVGGAQLEPELYFQARALGFPVLPSFGMTETCSQIATASPYSLTIKENLQKKIMPPLLKLPHVEVKTTEGDILSIKSKALFTCCAEWRPSQNEWSILWRAGEWYATKDRVKIAAIKDVAQTIAPLGRLTEQVKISGEMVDLNSLNIQFAQFLSSKTQAKMDFHIFAQPDLRRGHEVVICMPVEAYQAADSWVAEFNQTVLPVAKIQATYFVNKLPLSDLGKVKVRELKSQLGFE